MQILDLIEKLSWLREEIMGRNILFETPFGKKPLVYADYTASGRNIIYIENYLKYLMQFYANTHTEDDFTGKTMTRILHQSERKIKQYVNAGQGGKILFTGTGATGGITRLQQILGVYWSPVTEELIMNLMDVCKKDKDHQTCNKLLKQYIKERQPVIFVGPYEHHSNEIMWRHTLSDVIEIPQNQEGYFDLEALEQIISEEKYKDKQKIGSFSAASNVSGIKTPVYEVARILHRHNVLACFDFAACAPYIEIDMNKDDESYFDAIFLSPHKFLGGPGSSGLLIFNENIYNRDLPPTISAGGTVDYVNIEGETFIDDIETREKPGTPGILQGIKAAMVFDLKDKIGIDNIDRIEEYYLKKFYCAFEGNDNLIYYGPLNPVKKINIIPFNIKHNDRILHPKFVTKLLNDLFGIQTRAGCSCAGPYGHRLLNISDDISKKYNRCIINRKFSGIKPGWVRLNIHYTFSIDEFEYIIKAVRFLLKNAHLFLSVYEFDFFTGEWNHIDKIETPEVLDPEIDRILNEEKLKCKYVKNIKENFYNNLQQAEKILTSLKEVDDFQKFDDELEDLMFFYVKNVK